MASNPTAIQANNFTAVPNTTPGNPLTNVIILKPTLAAPNLTGVNAIADSIRQSIADDTKVVGATGSTALPPPDNIAFTDLTVNVSGTITGDKFVGTTTGITSQFVDLTPDNLLIRAITPNAFLRSDTGNDVLIANSGRNILSAGSGTNLMVGGSGTDTFISNASLSNASETILNFRSGDDAVMVGVDPSKFTLTLTDTLQGLVFDATPIAVPNTPAGPSAEITLAGFTTADIGTKLTLGASTTTDGRQFIFLHGN